MLHRDLKPSNIIVGTHGETLVVDWGLAKAMAGCRRLRRRDRRAAAGARRQPVEATETLPGLAIGTPSFMSPEQAAGDRTRIGPASDVYSLGATLYCLLTGRAPFERARHLPMCSRLSRMGSFRPREQVDQLDPQTARSGLLEGDGARAA